jgi:hypothetical protein
MSRPHPHRVILVAVVAATLAGAAPALAKDGVRATLEDPAALTRAVQGEALTIAWTLNGAPQMPVAGGERVPAHPFGASGVYVSVGSAAGGTPAVVAAHPPRGSRGYPAGRYLADVTVPRGGIGSLAIGLEGQRIVTGHAPVRADHFFPIANDPFPANGRRADGRDGSDDGLPWAPLGAVVLALALACALALVAISRRATKPTGIVGPAAPGRRAP